VPLVRRPDGATIAFEIAGDPRRRAIVLAGGIGGDAASWRRTVPHLATELLVVVVEHRGTGRSDDVASEPSMRTYAADVLAVLDEVRVQRAHLYGHSFGGQVALEVALEHQERVRTLVLGATHAGRSRATRTAARVPLARPWEALYSPAFVREHPDRVAEDRRATRRRHEGERRQARAAAAWDVWARLGEIRVPVLILHGSEDRLVDPANADALAREIPGARLEIIEGAGHAYHSEVPELADDLVLSFVRAHPEGP
jgi:3-oxoadipate enol-lactonase